MTADYLDDLRQSSSAEACMQVTQRHLGKMGFRNVVFAYTRRPMNVDGDLPPYMRFSSIPVSWEQRYRHAGYQNHCPLYRAGLRGTTLPLVWHQLWERVEQNAVQRQMVDEAASFGVANGISVAIRETNGDRCGVGISTDLDQGTAERVIDMHLPDLFLMSHYLHAEIVGRFLQTTKDEPRLVLTTSERDCLQWVAAGKGTWEISQIRGISENTVKFHLRNVMSKLGVTNRAAAVAKAYRLGLLQL